MKKKPYLLSGWRISVLFYLFVGVCIGWILVILIPYMIAKSLCV